MQPRLPIKILPRESEVDDGGDAIPIRIIIGCCGAEGIAVPGPDDGACLIGTAPRAAEVVGVQVGDGFRAATVDLGEGYGISIDDVTDRVA